jgi:hypothetical protein
MLKNKKETFGFILEVSLFVLVGYLFALKLYFHSFIVLGIALQVAFTVGEMIYKRGNKNSNR